MKNLITILCVMILGITASCQKDEQPDVIVNEGATIAIINGIEYRGFQKQILPASEEHTIFCPVGCRVSINGKLHEVSPNYKK